MKIEELKCKTNNTLELVFSSEIGKIFHTIYLQLISQGIYIKFEIILCSIPSQLPSLCAKHEF